MLAKRASHLTVSSKSATQARISRRGLGRAAAGATAALALRRPLTSASAQDYPTGPITIVCYLGAGGLTDVLARLVGRQLQERLKQTVVIENRSGAQGLVGIRSAARAAPDGHTLMMTSAAFAQLQVMTKEPGYDALKDFVPLVHFGSTPNIIVAHPSLPFRTLPELLAYAKTKPLTCASAAARLVQYFQAATGANLSVVSYKAGQQAIQDTVSGHVDLTLPPLPDAIPHIESGALRAIAVTGPKREARLPDIGTVAETAPGFRIVSWYGFTAPAGMPPAILERLRSELAAIVQTEEFRGFMTGRNITPTDAPGSLGEIIAADTALWRKLVVDLNIQPM